MTNCSSRITIKLLAATVHLQEFTTVWNDLLQPQGQTTWYTVEHTVEQWSCWRWWCLWVCLSTSLWPCPSKVNKKVLIECWVSECVYLLSVIKVSCRGKHEWVCNVRTQIVKLYIHSPFPGLLYSPLFIFSLTAMQLSQAGKFFG